MFFSRPPEPWKTGLTLYFLPLFFILQSLGWNTVVNLFYIPGAMLGSLLSDRIGPRYALAFGLVCQAVIGFIMAGLYDKLAQPSNVAAFAVVYGIFLSFGELGPGDNIGLLASKTSATAIRGQYYGIAAAIGKVGAFIGTYIFPYIQAAGGNETQSAQYPFWVASSLAVFSAILAIFFLPHIDQDTIAKEDVRFRAYLESNGWDTSMLGLAEYDTERSAVPLVIQQDTYNDSHEEKREEREVEDQGAKDLGEKR